MHRFARLTTLSLAALLLGSTLAGAEGFMLGIDISQQPTQRPPLEMGGSADDADDGGVTRPSIVIKPDTGFNAGGIKLHVPTGPQQGSLELPPGSFPIYLPRPVGAGDPGMRPADGADRQLALACEIIGTDIVLRNVGTVALAVGTKLRWRHDGESGVAVLSADMATGAALKLRDTIADTATGQPCDWQVI